MVRTGLMRRVGMSVQLKPAFMLGLASDGGVWAVPYQRSRGWRYGVLKQDVVATDSSIRIDVKPKVHYHRSGHASVTLTGHDLERRSLKLPMLSSLRASQIFSVSTVRTWELPTRTKSSPPGDGWTAVRRWPDLAHWGVFLLEATEDERRALFPDPDLPSVGLLAGDDFTHGVVSLAAYGREAILLITVETHDTWDDVPAQGGTTIAALPWHPGVWQEGDECLGLWSAGLRNPHVYWVDSAPDDLTPAWTTSDKPLIEDVDRMASLTVPDGGLRLRGRPRSWDDFAGSPFAVSLPSNSPAVSDTASGEA